MQSNKEEFYQFLAPLYFLFQLSGKAYEQYLQNKIYLNAAILRKSNKKILGLLNRNVAMIPRELLGDAVALINHYNSWLFQFKSHKEKINPTLTDIFVFDQADSTAAYPRQSEENFSRYYIQKKQELDNELLVKQGMRN